MGCLVNKSPGLHTSMVASSGKVGTACFSGVSSLDTDKDGCDFVLELNSTRLLTPPSLENEKMALHRCIANRTGSFLEDGR